MSRKNIIIGLVVVGVALLGAVAFALNFFLAPTLAPSASNATAVPLTMNTTDATIFQIDAAQSRAQFSIYEELGGEPKTVVGTTSDVTGQIALNLADLSKTQVGVIQVNARTLKTDNQMRNNTMSNRILQSGQYEFITFTPTSVTGLSGAAQPGQTVTFQVAGNLTIRNVTQPVVFTLSVAGESTSKLNGTATATVKRSDFQLNIPSVPNVANVGEEVTLEFDFVATAVN